MTDSPIGAGESPRALSSDDSAIPGISAEGALFPIGKMEAHRMGQLHQAVSVFVFCEDLLLLQRRASSKYHSGLLWANTCCSHPHWGESRAAAAKRRLFEELGLKTPLKPTSEMTYTADVGGNLIENERVQVFRGDVTDTSIDLALDVDEVCETRWVSVQNLRSTVEAEPEKYAPWFKIYVSRWDQLGL